jgi:4-hydroxy-2-oxoheptanedioate aldolase
MHRLVVLTSVVAVLGAGSAAQAPRLNRAIELLSQGQAAFGILSHDRSLDNARALARSGLDFLFIDMEHGPFDVETLRLFLVGMTDKQRILEKSNLQMDVTPLVRVPASGRDQTTYLVKQVLDAGAMGIMFPAINSAAEAELAVRSMRYPQLRGSADMNPAGLRGAAPVYAAWFWGIPDYQTRADVWPLDPQGELMAVIQIETAEGLQNVEAIAAVPGVSALFIGPADLSLSMGYTPDAPEVEAAVQRILQVARGRKLPIGITAAADTVERRLRDGFTLVTVGYGDGGVTPVAARTVAIARQVQAR